VRRRAILGMVGALLGRLVTTDAWADARQGLVLAEQWCAECHSVRRDRASGNPDLPTFSEIAAEPSATAYALRIFLRTPHATMPNFVLDADDIDDIVDYILSLKRRR
jgi:cytochrome c